MSSEEATALLRARAREHEQRQRGNGGLSEIGNIVRRFRPPVVRSDTWAPPVAMVHPLRDDPHWFVHPSNLEASVAVVFRLKADRGRTISLKFAGRCVSCGGVLAEGSQARWLGPARGVKCAPRCH